MPDKNIIPHPTNVSETYFENSSDLFFSGKISDEFLLPVIESYVRYYAIGDNHTAKAKRTDLKHFMNFLSSSQLPPNKVLVLDWTMQKTRDFIEHRMRLGESPATVSRRLATLKHLGRTLSERVPGFINPAREVKAPVYQTSKPQGLDISEINALKNQVNSDLQSSEFDFLKLRNSLVLSFLLATGLRADEVRRLIRGQFSESFDRIHHVKTKGKRYRDVYLPEVIRPILMNYFERVRQEIILKFPEAARFSKKEWDSFPFLISVHRASILNPLSFGLAPKTLWKIISDFGKTVRIKNNGKMSHLHPHKLRHTFAHGLLDSTNDVRLVAQALGHSDVRTTMRYTERSHEELAAAIEKKETL